MKNILFIPALLLLSLFSSCEKQADIDLPETTPKLVLVSFITPQDATLKVSVTRSTPIFQTYDINTTSAVINATVKMSGNPGTVQLTYDAILECYTASATALPILAGSTYTLSVTTPEGEAAEATTTVPLHNGVSGFSVTMTDSIEVDFWLTKLYTDFNYQVNDYAGETNYYRFFSAIIVRDTLTNDTSLLSYTTQLFTDNNVDGQQVRANLHGEWGSYNQSSAIVVLGYDCWMFNVNRDYYQYHNSLYNYTGDDPFSEPSLIYTNVKDGLGVFAAANGNKVRLYR